MMRSPLLTVGGAVPAEGVDAEVAAHYGDPMREQRMLAGDNGLVDRSNRGVVIVTGADRLTWLHSLTTQDLENLPRGKGTEALILDPNGHIEHHLTLVDDGETTWIHVEPTTAPALADWLLSMRFMMRVEVADVTEDVAVMTQSPGAKSLPHPTADGRLGRDVFLPRTEIMQHLPEEVELVGIWAYEALRIADLQPRLGIDTDDRTIPNESRWLHTAVHLAKGCYRGQETVARVSNLGQPPRRTLLMQLDGAADRLPERGAPVEMEERTVGRAGSSARHHEMGPIALGVVKRAAADRAFVEADATPVVVDGIAGMLEADPLQAPADRAPRPDLIRFA